MLEPFHPLRHRWPLSLCLSIAVFCFYESLLRGLPSLIEGNIREAYQLSVLSFGGLCASYYLLYAPLQLLVGLWVDRYRFRVLMGLAMLLSVTGCCLFANVHSLWLASLGRMAMGLGEAFIFVMVLKVLATRLPVAYFTFYLGIVVGVSMLGYVFLNSVLVVFIHYWGWRLLCYFLAVLGLLLIVVNYFWARRGHVIRRPSSDYPPLQNEFFEIKAHLHNPKLLMQCLIGTLLYLPIVGFSESWGVGFVRHLSPGSPPLASLQMALNFLGIAVGAPLMGWIYDRTQHYQLILTASAVAMTILLSIVIYVPALCALNVGIFLFLLGIFSSPIIIIFSLCRKLAPPSQVGKAFGVANFFIALGGSVIWLVGFLLQVVSQHRLSEFLPGYAISSYQLALLVLPCGLLLAVFLTFFIRDVESP